MSKRMADAFFPASLKVINGNTNLSFIYHIVIFPEATAEECPEYVVTVDERIQIRQPCLLLSAFWGVWIGLVGYQRLNRGHNPYWALALLTFGFMNISAIWVHCIWPAPVPDYPTNYPLFWAIDTYMTGVSGCYLLVASLEDLRIRWELSTLGSGRLPFLSNATQFIGALCILLFVSDPAPSIMMASHPLELWYLLPPLLAALPVVLWVFQDIRDLSFSFTSGQLAFISAIPVAIVLGVAMDHVWCSVVGYSLARDFLSANTLVFLGCDLAFWGILAIAEQRLSLKHETAKKQH
jgi:hypothetical protein